MAGTREAPLSHAVSTSPEAPPTASDDTLLHIGIAVGAGGLALVIAIVVAVVVTSQPSNQTRLEGPVIVGF